MVRRNRFLYIIEHVLIVNLGAIPTSKAPRCAGDPNATLNINPYGGTAPYTFTVDGQPSGANASVIPGQHHIFMQDSQGCTLALYHYVPQRSVLRASIISQPVRCHGETDGVISVQGLGGSSPYTYSISGNDTASNLSVSNTFYNLTAGSYAVLKFLNLILSCLLIRH